jgi:hypothetical protein
MERRYNMSDAMTIQPYDNGSVAIGNNEYKSGKIKFPGADSYLEGTIMALKEVADAVTVTPDGGNTGDGTVTSVSPSAGLIIPSVGDYNLECTFAVANGGVFKLEDPNGNIVADNLTLRVGAGLATAFSVAGLEFTITDGAADFIAGDKFALAVAADGDFVIYAVDGIGGAQEARYVLKEDYTSTGAADLAGRVMTAGKVRTDRLIIDGSLAGVGITDAVKDKLRHYGINPIDTKDLSQLDNQ